MCQIITDYNKNLVDNKINITITEYAKNINKLIYNIDMPFFNDFIEFVGKDDFCIHHNMLSKYGLLSLNSGSTDVNRLLDNNMFIKDHDYLIRNVAEQLPSGTKYKKEYYLLPQTFKICLMRSLKNKIYADYFLSLEQAIKYYNDYQMLLNDTFIIELKSQIVHLETTILDLI